MVIVTSHDSDDSLHEPGDIAPNPSSILRRESDSLHEPGDIPPNPSSILRRKSSTPEEGMP